MDVSNTKKCITEIKNLDQWLNYTNTKCNDLGSHMQYMKMLWDERQPEFSELKTNIESLDYHNSTTQVLDSMQTQTPLQMNYDCLQEVSEEQLASEDNNDDSNTRGSSNTTANLENIVPKITVQHREPEMIKNINVQKETKAELTTFTPRTYSITRSARTMPRPQSPLQEQNKHKEYNGNWQYPSWNHLAEYSEGLIQDAVDPKKSFEQLMMENQNEILLQELSSARTDMKLNSSGNAKTGAIGKNKIRAKNDKKEKIIFSALSSKKGSLCKLDDITSLKLKKRRRKLHSCNSKSTIITRDTSVLGRKDAKKRKQKNIVNNRHALKPHQTSNEVVEIYHNAATKSGSIPVISNKHPKLDCHTNYINRLSPAANKQQSAHMKLKCENNNYQHNVNVDESNQQDCSEKQCQSKQKTEGKTMNAHDKTGNLEVATTPVYAVEKFNSHRPNSIMQSYCDPMITHSYEMPTLASKLKRVNRSYFSRFNFRNIPFVVGTSVTPSHNLGLNIQQVLSIMKTRQSTANAPITPLLIRKVSKGIKPVSILMDQINDQCAKLPYMNSGIITTAIEKENLIANNPDHLYKTEEISLQYGSKRLSSCTFNINSKPLESLQEKKDTKSENQLSGCHTARTSKNSGNVRPLKLYSSQQNVKNKMDGLDIRPKHYQGSVCDMDINDGQSVNHTQSSKGIKEVLINLHDQFEEMNSKYEKLQTQVEKHNDKKLEEEISTLEKELNAKEDEINAVVNLYKEVMVLKQQMKQLHQKNSYVCISTEVPFEANNTCLSGQFMSGQSCGKNFQQKAPHRKGVMVPPREPTSLRLAGLLRQIQVFQKQLSSR